MRYQEIEYINGSFNQLNNCTKLEYYKFKILIYPPWQEISTCYFSFSSRRQLLSRTSMYLVQLLISLVNLSQKLWSNMQRFSSLFHYLIVLFLMLSNPSKATKEVLSEENYASSLLLKSVKIVRTWFILVLKINFSIQFDEKIISLKGQCFFL